MQLSPEQFHTLFDRAAQPVLLVQDGVITQCSSRAEGLIAPGSPIRELLPPDAVLQELIAAAPTVLPLRLRTGYVTAQVQPLEGALLLFLPVGAGSCASEELSVRNAIPTAEGAIEAAMKHTSVTLHGTPCLVLGFGRIGKVLAHDLSALGAKVSVSARKRSDLAWIDAFGYAPLHTNRLSGTLGEFRVVFNTVPHQVLDETLLAELPPDCLLIELASASGFDMDAVETLRLSYLKAGGLPGRVAPETAARAIKKTLCRLIKEEA